MTSTSLVPPEASSTHVARWLRSEVVVVAGAPALAYAVAYAYELGYADHYGIPRFVIVVSLSNVLWALGSLTLLTLYLFGYLNLVFMIVRSQDLSPEWERRLRTLGPAFCLSAVGVYLGTRGLPEWYWSCVIAALLVFAEFGVPLIRHRNVRGLNRKLRAQDRDDAQSDTLYRVAANIVGGAGLALVAWLIVILVSAHMVGKADAISETRFYVHTGSQDLVLIRRYGETGVSVGVDRAKHRLDGRFVLHSVDRDESIPLRQEELGRLESCQ